MAFKNPEQQAQAMMKPEFKLDKEKYPDVEETPYGFIYNVNGHSITDHNAMRKSWGDRFYDPEKDYGWTLAVGGDESFYPDFESAYKAAKGIK